MSITHTNKSIHRLAVKITELEKKYHSNLLVSSELKKLNRDLKELEHYLNNLDQLKPNYTTNVLNDHINAIALHVDILKGEKDKQEFDAKDILSIQHGLKIIKTMLKFHPTKHSYLAFITSWFMEWLYFI